MELKIVGFSNCIFFFMFSDFLKKRQPDAGSSALLVGFVLCFDPPGPRRAGVRPLTQMIAKEFRRCIWVVQWGGTSGSLLKPRICRIRWCNAELLGIYPTLEGEAIIKKKKKSLFNETTPFREWVCINVKWTWRFPCHLALFYGSTSYQNEMAGRGPFLPRSWSVFCCLGSSGFPE